LCFSFSKTDGSIVPQIPKKGNKKPPLGRKKKSPAEISRNDTERVREVTIRTAAMPANAHKNPRFGK